MKKQTVTQKLTHFDTQGQAWMVDVAGKAETKRLARASGRIVMLPATLRHIIAGTAKKGDVLGIARIHLREAGRARPRRLHLRGGASGRHPRAAALLH